MCFYQKVGGKTVFFVFPGYIMHFYTLPDTQKTSIFGPATKL